MRHQAVPALAVMWSAEWLAKYALYMQRQALAVWAGWVLA
jgi:hypothetical protein